MKTQQELNVKTVRRKLVFALIVCIIVTDSLIVFTPQEKRLVVGDIAVPTSIIIATALSLIVVYRQKTDGLIGKAYAFLALGLTLWCIAEILWSITELVFGQKRPFPSVSDGLWLIAYGPLIYYAFRMYDAFHKSSSSKFSIVLISIGVAAYLLYTIPLTASTFELSKQDDVYLFLISISYSILDMVFIFPASLIILNAPKRGIGGDLTSIPWIFLAMVVIAVADIVFGFTSVAGLDRLEWTSTPIYSAGYLLMAVGLFWHNRFFIFDEKKVNENWQKENR